jgi:cation-transporting ATPase 13A3/4/5
MFYSRYENVDSEERRGYENYAVFTISSLQYIILALVFSKGAPYRKSLFASPFLIFLAMIITAFTLYLVIKPTEWLAKNFQMTLPPNMTFRIVMVSAGVINLVIAFAYEYFCDCLRTFVNR